MTALTFSHTTLLLCRRITHLLLSHTALALCRPITLLNLFLSSMERESHTKCDYSETHCELFAGYVVDAVKEYHARRKRELHAKNKLEQVAHEEDNDQNGADDAKLQRLCNDLVKLFNRHTKTLNVAKCSHIFCRFVNHPSLGYLEMPRAQTNFVEAIRNTIDAIKLPKGKRELFLKRFITTMIMTIECTSTSKVNVLATSKLLNFHKRNFIAAKNQLRAAGDGNFPISLYA